MGGAGGGDGGGGEGREMMKISFYGKWSLVKSPMAKEIRFITLIELKKTFNIK